MEASSRRNFLTKTFLATIGFILGPKILKATVVAKGSYHPSYFGIVDLHCHPSLKMYLWGRKFWRSHTPGLGVNAFDLQDDYGQLTSGSVPNDPAGSYDQINGLVKGIVVAHYLPEEGVYEQWDFLKGIYPWVGRLFRNFAGKLENGDHSNIDQTLRIISVMEEQVMRINAHQNQVEFVIAKSFKDFQDSIKNGKFPIAHAVEGAHSLGRNKSGFNNVGRKRLPEEGKMMPKGEGDSSKYIENLATLKDKGVCMMTLAHLFPNDIAYCVEGIAPDAKKGLKMAWAYDNTPNYNLPLTKVGSDVVDWMLANGMIIDLTHSTPATRDQIFFKNQHWGCPLVFTHTGAQAVFDKYDDGKFPTFKFYCVTDEEIAGICSCGGTIGVIPEVFWLAGGDTHLRHKGLQPKLFRNGIPYMVETIKYINSKTPDQDYNNISIGTDFDGYSDEPQDLYEATQLDALIEALRSESISDENIQKIMSVNALRVLERGWL
jgi:microsomal dipeptidase-like Zn-dependent dipeptidase